VPSAKESRYNEDVPLTYNAEGSEDTIMKPQKRSLRHFSIEFMCSLSIVIVSLCLYLQVIQQREDPLEHPALLQTNMFYPAVFFAAGRGLGTADISKVPGLEDFIYKRSMDFDVNNIAADLEVVPLNSVFESSHLYLLYGLGWCWRLFGVSAWVAALYVGIMCAFCSLALYGILRLVLGRTSSFLGTLVIASSPLLINGAIEIRDLGKVPFILGFLFASAWLLKTKHSSRALLSAAALLGLFLGVGLGFRQDLLVCLPIAIAIFLVLVKLDNKKTIVPRIMATCLFLVCFVVAAAPIIKAIALEGGQASLHGFLHGISPESEGRFDFGGAAYDSLLSVDPANFAIVSAYAQRSGNTTSMVNKYSSEYLRLQGDKTAPLLRDPYIYFTGSEYGKWANKVIMEYLKLFPADIVSRAWRAVFSTQLIPLKMHNIMKESFPNPPAWMQALLLLHRHLARHLTQFGLFYLVCIGLALSLRHPFNAVCLFAFYAWFAGYPSIWYEIRHLFFLGFFPYLAMIIFWIGLIQLLIHCYTKERRRRLVTLYFENGLWKKSLRNGAAFVTVAALAILLPTGLLRLWQIHQVQGFAQSLTAEALEPISVEQRITDGQLILAPMQKLPGLLDADSLPAGETAWEYVAVQINTKGADIPLTIHYDKTHIIYDLSQDIGIRGIKDNGEGTLTLFFPIYETFMNYGGELMPSEILKNFPTFKHMIQDVRPIAEQDWWKRGKFLGISFPEQYAVSFQGFFRLPNPRHMKLLPIFQVPEDLRFLRSYKTGPWERYLRHLPSLWPDYQKSPWKVTD